MTTKKTHRLFRTCLAAFVVLAGMSSSGPATAGDEDIFRRPRTAASSLADQLVIRARLLLKTQGQIVDHQYRRARVLLDLAMDLAPNDPYIMRVRLDLAKLAGPPEKQLEALREYLKLVKDEDAPQLEYVRLLVEEEDRIDDRVRRVEQILAGQFAERLSDALRSRLASYCAAGAREVGDMKRFRQHLTTALHLDQTNAEAAIMMYEDVSAGPPDVMNRAASLLWMMRAQPLAVEPRRALGELLLGQAAFASSAEQFRGVQLAAGMRLDDQFYHDWAMGLASQGDEVGTYGALRVLGQYGPVRRGVAAAPEGEEEEQAASAESPSEEEEEQQPVEAPRLPLDLELIQLAVMQSESRMPVQLAASYRRIVRTLNEMYGDEGTAEIDKALLTAWLGRQELPDEVINELEVEYGTDNLAIQRMHGWLEWHAGNVESARGIFRTIVGVNPADGYAMYGLAETYSHDPSSPLRVTYLNEVVTRWPGTLPAMLAARDLHALDIEAPIRPAGIRLQKLLGEIPLDLRLPDPYQRGWTGIRLEIPQKRYGLFDPIYATLYLRNTSDIPLAIGGEGAMPSRVFVIISVRITGRYMGTMPAIVVDLKRRLTLQPGEEMEVPVRLDHSTFGRVLRSNITDVINFDVKALLDPVPMEEGDIAVGLLGAESTVHNLQRWGQPFNADDVDKWLSALEDPNDLRQLEAYAWLGNTAYWLIASAKNGRNSLERIIAKQARDEEEEDEEDLSEDIESLGTRGAIEVDESSEVTTEQIENMERVIASYERSSHQISDAYIARYPSLDPVRQAWMMLFLPGTREVKAQFGPIYSGAAASEEPVVRVTYLAASGLRPGDVTLDAAATSENPEIRDFAEALLQIFDLMQKGQ